MAAGNAARRRTAGVVCDQGGAQVRLFLQDALVCQPEAESCHAKSRVRTGRLVELVAACGEAGWDRGRGRKGAGRKGVKAKERQDRQQRDGWRSASKTEERE